MSFKPIFARTFFAIAAIAAIANPVAADPIAGAAIGAGAGALVGHSVSGRDGALVGGAIGAVAGAAIGAHHRNHRRHYSSYRTYHAAPVRYTRYRAAPVYYAPRAYYAPATVQTVHHVSRPVVYRAHRHLHYYHDRHGRLVRYYSWR